MPALDSIRITDRSVILRAAAAEAGAVEMVTRRWSWPAPNGKPVYNFRSEGREFQNRRTSGRCLIPADSFYEYTDAPAGGAPAADLFGSVVAVPAKRSSKAKWAFSIPGLEWFCIAGLWRADPRVGEAWTMLTVESGADVAPYHDRQIVLVTPSDYRGWLNGETPAAALCGPLPAGTLAVERVR